MEITVNIQAPALVEAINTFAAAIEARNHTFVQNELKISAPALTQAQAQQVIEAVAEPIKPFEPAVDPATQVNPEAIHDELKTTLTALAKAGHTAKVKALLLESGANKLSELDPAKYAEVLAKAKAIA